LYILCHVNQRMVQGFQSQATMQCDQRYFIVIAFLEKHKVISSKKNLPHYLKFFCELSYKKYRMGGVKFLQGRFHFLFICMWSFANGCWKTGRFAHLFLVLSWNLACRSSNTRIFHYHPMQCIQDASQFFLLT